MSGRENGENVEEKSLHALFKQLSTPQNNHLTLSMLLVSFEYVKKVFSAL
jgi:hypothetical protein